MDDAFIMTTAFFDSFSPPFLNGQSESQPRRLASPPANCSMCGEPLIQMEFPKGFEIVCDNWRCHMYRQSQGCRTKDPPEGKSKPSIAKTQQPNYQDYLEQRKYNYRWLREHGFGSVQAALFCTNKKVREIEEQLGQGATQLPLLRE